MEDVEWEEFGGEGCKSSFESSTKKCSWSSSSLVCLFISQDMKELVLLKNDFQSMVCTHGLCASVSTVLIDMLSRVTDALLVLHLGHTLRLFTGITQQLLGTC